MNKLTYLMVKHAHAVAREMGAEAVMFDVDALGSSDDLNEVLKEVDYRVVLVSRKKEVPDLPKSDLVKFISIPNVPLTRLGQIKIAILIGMAEKIFGGSDLIVCLFGTQTSDRLDMMAVVRVGEEPEYFVSDEQHPLPPDVTPAVFEHCLRIVSELAVEGREHRPVGVIFVVGDEEKVMENSRQLVFNPFKGYSDEERNILSGELDETIKEFAAIDGAFLIRGDGVVLAAGRYLVPKGKSPEPLRSGLGARHAAAAAITAVTDAVAITLSESTATITVFNSGRVMTEIERVKGGVRRNRGAEQLD